MSPCVAHGLCVYLIHCPHETCLHPSSVSRRKDLFLPSSPSSVLAVSLISVFSLQWQTLPAVSVSLSLCRYYSSGNHLYQGWIRGPCACWASSLEHLSSPILTAFPPIQSIPPLSVWLLNKFLLNGHKTRAQRRQAGKLCPCALVCPPSWKQLISISSVRLFRVRADCVTVKFCLWVKGLLLCQTHRELMCWHPSFQMSSGQHAYCALLFPGLACGSLLWTNGFFSSFDWLNLLP